jgi:adenylate cyclase
MGIEIERKFLVTNDDFKRLAQPRLLKQGYIYNSKKKTVRVRIDDTKGFITIKGALAGISRREFEYELPIDDAETLLTTMCDPSIIEKLRYKVSFKGHLWEIDEFLGENAGLIVAEIELDREDVIFDKPEWIGDEVTNDPKYLNSSLAKRPYRLW